MAKPKKKTKSKYDNMTIDKLIRIIEVRDLVIKDLEFQLDNHKTTNIRAYHTLKEFKGLLNAIT